MKREDWLKVRGTRPMRLRDWFLRAAQTGGIVCLTSEHKKPEPYDKDRRAAKQRAWDWKMRVRKQRRLVKQSRVQV